jgi:hypothetical protein
MLWSDMKWEDFSLGAWMRMSGSEQGTRARLRPPVYCVRPCRTTRSPPHASLIYRLIYHGLRSIHRNNCPHDRPKPVRCPHCLKIEAFTAVTTKSVALWITTPCSSVSVGRFGVTYRFHLQCRKSRQTRSQHKQAASWAHLNLRPWRWRRFHRYNPEDLIVFFSKLCRG